MNRKRDDTKSSGCDVLQKITLLCAVFLLCVAVLPATVSAVADYGWYDDGSSSDFAISNVDELIGFANIVNGVAPNNIGKDTFKDKTVRLTADIDLTGVTWTPIGSSMYASLPTDTTTKMFEGTFDGCGHTITGLSDTGYSPLIADVGSPNSNEYSFGLFGYVYGANITNVNLVSVNINACEKTVFDMPSRTVYGSGVAALIGYYFPKNSAVSVIENCHVLSGSVRASNNMGGLIGYIESKTTLPIVDVTIKNCSNAAGVTAEARQAGGILGLLQSSRNELTELSMQGTIVFENCENTGDITTLDAASPVRVGGILGDDSTEDAWQHLHIIFDRCKNSGNITAHAKGETHAAGIGVGHYRDQGSRIIVKDCENIGTVTVLNPASGGEIYAGGLVSHACTVELINSISTGTVKIGDSNGNLYVGYAKILFVEGIDYTEDSHGRIYYLMGGRAPERNALHDDSGNYDKIPVRTAYKDGYIFEGWYYNSECTGSACNFNTQLWKQEGDKLVRSDPVRLYAKWIPAITFNANGGTGNMNPANLETTQLPPNSFTRSDYRFAGWNTKADGTGMTTYKDEASISVTESTVLYAQWDSVVKFDANGGSGEMSEMAIREGNTANLNTNTFTLSGYEFAGWTTEADGTGTNYADEASITPTGNITLFAKWKGAITFNANDGTDNQAKQPILKGNPVTLDENPFTRTGYVFNKWYTAFDGTGNSYADKAQIECAENMVLYANWTECNDHTFTKKVATPDYLKSAATYTQKAVYYTSCIKCGTSSEGKEGEVTFEHGDVLEKVTTSQGGSSTGGTYITMTRDVPENGGEVLFKNSATPVDSVTVPAGIVDGDIVVSAITDADAPEGKEVEALFEVSITGSYPAGAESIITVSLSKSELTKRGLTEADACLYHFDGEKWTKLFTTYEVNGDSIIYCGITESFSPFALVYEIGGAVPVDEEKPVDEPIEEPSVDVPSEVLPPIVDPPTETPETPMPMFGILAGIGCAAILLRRK